MPAYWVGHVAYEVTPYEIHHILRRGEVNGYPRVDSPFLVSVGLTMGLLFFAQARKRSREKFRPWVIAVRSTFTAESIQPLPSRNWR